MNTKGFWDNKEEAELTLEELNNLKKAVSNIKKIKTTIDSNIETLELLEVSYDEEIKLVVENDLDNIIIDINNLELEILLKDPQDKNNAILEVHSGAGGTEACDWAYMLYRMYIRWCEKKNYKYEIIDILDGEEAGIKSASILIKGLNAYGYLKSERGVHRLIRISPFDSNKRRHTSFASVEVIPEMDNNIQIEIKDQDVKIDVYRSSGAGGQGVNTTDSAVRITHLLTNIVVTCQNERSQIKNKEKALQILKIKLYQREQEIQKESLSNLKSDHMGIDFGSQIRSYIMQPYSMVKDHRTNTETSNVLKVLDGDIDLFIESYLKGEIKNAN